MIVSCRFFCAALRALGEIHGDIDATAEELERLRDEIAMVESVYLACRDRHVEMKREENVI